MVSISFDGLGLKKFDRAFLSPDAYIGTIKRFSEIFKTKAFNDNTKEVEKLVVTLEVVSDKNTLEVPYFVSASVKHSAKKEGFSDSKLYTFLEMSGKLNEFKTFWESTKATSEEQKNAEFVSWLTQHMCGMKVKFMPKTVAPAEGSKYSVVSEIINFPDAVLTEDVK